MWKTIIFVLGFAMIPPQNMLADTTAAAEINNLLRGELAAVDTYKQALENLEDEPNAKVLWEALDNHKDAMKKLSKEVTKLKAIPSTDAGAWGAWAGTVVGSGKLLGDKAALKALKEGEEHGLKEYKSALEKPQIPERVKKLIRNKFIERQEQHIANVDRMLNPK